MTLSRLFTAFALVACIVVAAFAPAAVASPSDDFADAAAIDITGLRGSTNTADLSGATRESGEPTVPGSNTAHTVWWRYTAALTGFVRFSTCAPTGTNPVPGLSLGLYTGGSVSALTPLDQKTNNCPTGFDNAVIGPVAVTAGSYYWLQIGGANTLNAGETDMVVTMDFNTTVPVNDNWANATNITGSLPQTFSTDNGLATVENGEPFSDAGSERQTLWWKWTAPQSGIISVDTCTSATAPGKDSYLTVFSGSSPASFAELGNEIDVGGGCSGTNTDLSKGFVAVNSGTTYWIKLSNNSLNYGFPYTLQVKWVTKPDYSDPPTLASNTIKRGNPATGNDANWTGDPGVTVTNKWQRCDVNGANCVVIAGATGYTYVTQPADVGSTLRFGQTGSNVNGSTTVYSDPSNPIDDTPANDNWANATNLGTGSNINYTDDNNWAGTEVGEPTIAGFVARNTVWYRWTPAVGGNYTINNCLGGGSGIEFLDLMIGIYTGAGPITTITTAGGADDGCGPYHQERTSMLFTATAGTTYTIQVASHFAGFTGPFALQIKPVGNPDVTVNPSLSGTAAVGENLTLDQGDWISPTLIFPNIQWYKCDAAGNNCGSSVQNGGTVFSIPQSFGGSTVKASVTLTNPYGTVTNSVVSDPIPADQDGDGVNDTLDVCPTDPGNKPNGCPASNITGTGVPTISGTFMAGQTLTANPGTWDVTGDPLGYSVAHQWQRCTTTSPASCSNISGATGATYQLTAGDLTRYIRVVDTASNSDDAGEVQSSALGGPVVAPPSPPTNSTPPAVTGTPIVGEVLSTSDGTWTNGPAFTYKWLRCTDNTTIGSCSVISGATASTYTLVSADLGRYIRSRVNGSNVAGNNDADSAPTAIVTGDTDGDGVPDVNDTCPAESGTKPNGCLPSVITGTGVPTISGLLRVGQTASSSQGSWTVAHDPLGYTVSHKWQRCDTTSAASCSDISGATSDTYVLAQADYGKYVRVIATASNADDTKSQNSSIVGPIGQIPGALSNPVVSGTAMESEVLSTTDGAWVPFDTTFSYSWLRCIDNVSVGSCSAIGSATSSTYTLAAADIGKYIRSRVTGTNGTGSDFADSAPTAVITADTDADNDGVDDVDDDCPAVPGTKPNGCNPSVLVPDTVPTIVGSPQIVGDSVSSTPGTWTVQNDQLGYSLAYQWQRCTSASTSSCSDIASATSSTYTPVSADYTNRLRLKVTASNADDTDDQFTSVGNPVEQYPVNQTAPTASGTALEGVTLNGTRGTWTPGDATLTSIWQRCDDTSTSSCSPIAGETGLNYALGSADIGKYIRIRVTGSTPVGDSDAFSAPIGPVLGDGDGDGVDNGSDACPGEAGTKPNGCLPSDVVAVSPPTVSGTLAVGSGLSTTNGAFNTLHDQLPLSYSFQWQRCSSSLPASCSNIGGATSSSYTLVSGDYHQFFRVRVTASNADDSDFQFSAVTGEVSQTPVNDTLPSVSGGSVTGSVLTGSQGSWTPGDSTLSNQWLACDDSTVGSCSDIPSETGSTYTIAAGDVGKYIRLRVHAVTAAGSADATSAAVGPAQLDSDGDGVADTSDACPAEAGTKPNGCLPSDVVAVSPPNVTGTNNVGNTLASDTGVWQVLHDQLTLSYSYQWQRCDSTSAATCSNIGGATSSTHLLVSADYGKHIRVTVTASNSDDNAAQSSAIGAAVSQVPSASTQPSISGTAVEGLALTGNQGTWSPGDAALANEWLRCDDTTLGSCSVIGGETGGTYILTGADTTKYIRLRVTATTTAASTPATSAASGPVLPDADGDGVPDGSDACPGEAGTKPNGCLPSDVVAVNPPSVLGVYNVGEDLAADLGVWQVLHDQLPLSYAYQWQRCNTSAAGSCSDISGATTGGLTLSPADYGKYIRVQLTASNTDDTATQSSTVTGPVSQVPSNSVLPTVSGTTTVGQTLNGTLGAWQPGDASFSTSWLRCDDATIGSCSPIGASGTSYTLVAADEGKRIRLEVTATTSAGDTPATSAATAAVIVDNDGDGVADGSDACPAEAGTKPNGCLPSVVSGVSAPNLSGTFEIPNTVSTDDGVWQVLHDQLPLSYSYQWQRCNTTSTASCSDIGGQTASSLTLSSADYGKYVRVGVTASNADDAATQYSAISVQIWQQPSNTAPPTVTGINGVGDPQTAHQGTWTPAAATLATEWLRCDDDSDTGTCSVIAGETGATYLAGGADLHKYLRIRVTATTPAGSDVAISAATLEIVADSDGDGVDDVDDTCPGEAGTKPNGCDPSDIVASGIPVVSGVLTVGETLSTTDGDWTVLHDPLGFSVAYQWQSCTSSAPASCSDISGATSDTYTLTAGDYGQYIRSVTTASNADDSAFQESAVTARVSATPANATPPTVTGTPRVTEDLTGDPGTWTPDDVALDYAWMRCDTTAFGSCTTIPGETTDTHTLVPADDGKYIRFVVTAQNSSGTAVLESGNAGPVFTDTDSDGVHDGSDACPVDAGDGRPNGCPASEIFSASPPVVTGTLVAGQTLSVSDGTWNVTGDQLGYSLSYEWLLCADTSLASCNGVLGETSNTFTIPTGVFGNYVRANVIASNADDSTNAYSTAVGPTDEAPYTIFSPAVSGTAEVGATLSAYDGEYGPSNVTTSRQWQRCDDALLVSCTPIAGETGADYTITAPDYGKYLTLSVHVSNTVDNFDAVAPATAQVAAGILDTDGDGVLNADDTCPTQVGDGRPNGCPPSDIQYVSDPTITGTPLVGDTLTAVAGGWTVDGDPLPLTHSYAWDVCATSNPITCSSTGVTGTTFTPTAAHYKQYVRVTETVVNADDGDQATSSIIGPIEQMPTNSVAPSLSGTPEENQLITAADGTWAPGDVVLTYAWLRCDDTTLSNCVTVGGELSSNYTPSAADIGKYIRVEVTGTTTAGSLPVKSAPIGPVTAAPVDTDGDGIFDGSDACPTEVGDGRPNGCPPSDIVGAGVPTLSGTFEVGQQISTTDGVWNVLHDQLGYSIAINWQRCDTSVGSCNPISGATGSNYTLVAADYGKYIRTVVTATNADDIATQSSAISAAVSQIPVNDTLPTVTGTASVGQTLTGGQGAWTPADAALANQWMRCTDNTSPGSCSVIAGETGSTYLLAAADDLSYIRLRVRATTSAGPTTAFSAATALVTTPGVDTDSDGIDDPSDSCPTEAGDGRPNGCPPSDIVGVGAPTLSGTFDVGQLISTDDGVWNVLHDQLGYSLTYAWERCDTLSTSSCSSIGGATTNSYTLVSADYGKRIRSVVTATNSDDIASQASAISAVISQVPVNNVAPTLSGVELVGQTLTGNQGSWTPADATLANQWMRCSDNASTASCSPISGATGSSYTLVGADDSNYIRLRVTATTTAASTPTFTAASAIVTTPPPDSDGDGVPDGSDTCPAEAGTKPNGCLPAVLVSSTAPTVTGTPDVGQTLTRTTGTWTVQHDPLGYATSTQWERCDDAGGSSCSSVSGQTGATYALTSADYGKYLRVVVTASNSDDSDDQVSALTARISDIPANSVAPSVTGTALTGSTLTANQGTWTPGDAVLTNAWLRCDDATLGSCSPVGGQTGSTYALTNADLTKYIRVQVTATAAPHSTVLASAPVGPINFPDGDGDGVADANDDCQAEVGTKPNGCLPSDIVGTGVPTISGTLQTLSVLSSTAGTWNVLHDQLGYTTTRQWQRCDDLTTGSCSDIPSETNATYTTTAADIGKHLRVVVTAQNADDTEVQASTITATAIVPAPPPVNSTLPDISGSAQVGQLLSTGGGVWTPAETTLTYEWLRCDDTTLGSCIAITGATLPAYQVTAADLGKILRVRVTGSANAQTDVAVSGPTAQVTEAPAGGGGGVTPTPPGNPASILGPKKGRVITVKIDGKGRIYVSRVSVYCTMESKGNCSGNVAVTARLGGKRVTIGGFKLKTLRGGGRTLRIKLSSGARSYLRKHSTLRAKLSVDYKSPGVTTSKYSVDLKIKR